MWYMVVVYLLIPTSNHNLNLTNKIQSEVVYLLIPTSNHNVKQWHSHVLKLYIFWFLHQTTTRLRPALILGRCISFDSYIKPQRLSYWWRLADVVYLLIPTSNHNYFAECSNYGFVVYLLIPTSNHNSWLRCNQPWLVVYLLIPTSNHNLRLGWVGKRFVVYLLIPTSNHN